MLLKILFWLIVCLDVAVLLLFFVLGLAAAPSSRTSPLSVAAYMLLLPGLVLAASIFLFLRSTSALPRIAALLLVAAPGLVVLAWKGIETVRLNTNMDSQGNLTFFPEGKLRDIANAITNNDAATVTTLASQVDVNSRGYDDTTLLLLAFRQIRLTPDRLEVLRALMKAGANPNLGNIEMPLELAIQVSAKAGPEPVQLMLAAGANPNLKNTFGTPLYFGACGGTTNMEVLTALLDHGADLKATSSQTETAVSYAATSQNWTAALFLLQRGATWKQYRAPDGLTLKDMAESNLRVYGDKPGLKEVIEFLSR